MTGTPDSGAEGLPPLLLEPLVRAALAEDLAPNGDITTASVVPAGTVARAQILARAAGRIAGLDLVRMSFALIDPGLRLTFSARDGADVAAGTTLVTLEGDAASILQGERVALNFLGALSGIATVTQRCAAAASGTRAKICCTRKTTPGLRALQKYAVRVGGGSNHRFGLSDAVLIKDNHIAVAGGITAAVERAKKRAGHMVKIEVEIDGLFQLDEALAAGADVIMLDNMSLADMKTAVARVKGRAVLEASGGVTEARVAEIAATGVDFISIGWITHSAPTLDVALDIDTLL
jgi:nicotinate-nucleotide pyrophosphorylase (carboxylating)